jgi:hypothetical protein
MADGIEGADVPPEGRIGARLDLAVVGTTILPEGGDRLILGRSYCYSGHCLLGGSHPPSWMVRAMA